AASLSGWRRDDLQPYAARYGSLDDGADPGPTNGGQRGVAAASIEIGVILLSLYCATAARSVICRRIDLVSPCADTLEARSLGSCRMAKGLHRCGVARAASLGKRQKHALDPHRRVVELRGG